MNAKYLSVNLKVLRFCGLWNSYSPGSFKRSLYDVFTGVVIVVFMLHLSTEFAFVLCNVSDLDRVSASASVTFTFSTAFLKMALVLRRRRLLRHVTQRLVRGSLCPGLGTTAGERSILDEADKLARRLSKWYYAMNAVATGLFFSSVLIAILSNVPESTTSLANDNVFVPGHEGNCTREPILNILTVISGTFGRWTAIHSTASTQNDSCALETKRRGGSTREAVPATRTLVYPAVFPLDVNETWIYIVAVTFQLLGPGVFGPAVNIGLDTFIVSLLVHLRGQLRVLKHLLRGVEAAARDEVGRHIEDRTPLRAGSCSLRILTTAHEEPTLVLMKQCIVRHQRIFRLIEQLNIVLSPILFTQFFFSLCTFCLIVFQITLARDSTITLSKYAFFLATALIELLLYCWFGSQLFEESLEVSEAIYDCPWYHRSEEFKKITTFMICRSQMPAQLNGLSFYKVNLETYMGMLSASFSYYTVLRQIYSS